MFPSHPHVTQLLSSPPVGSLCILQSESMLPALMGMEMLLVRLLAAMEARGIALDAAVLDAHNCTHPRCPLLPPVTFAYTCRASRCFLH
jgi:hypothetical protein